MGKGLMREGRREGRDGEGINEGGRERGREGWWKGGRVEGGWRKGGWMIGWRVGWGWNVGWREIKRVGGMEREEGLEGSMERVGGGWEAGRVGGREGWDWDGKEGGSG